MGHFRGAIGLGAQGRRGARLVHCTYFIVLVKERHYLRCWRSRSRWRRRCFPRRISGIGELAAAVGATVAIGSAARVFACQGSRQAPLRAIAPWELLAEEALQLSKAAPGAARLGARTADCCRDASYRWAPVVIVRGRAAIVVFDKHESRPGPCAKVVRRLLDLSWLCPGQALAGIIVEARLHSLIGR